MLGTDFVNCTGRFVCMGCLEELKCLRIGVWRCEFCLREGSIDHVFFTVVRVEHGHEGESLSTPELFKSFPYRSEDAARIEAP